MGNGPYRWGANFTVGWWVFKLRPSSHTCSPSLKFTGISHSFEIRRASLALLQAALICLSWVMTSGVFASSSDKGNSGFVPNRSLCRVRVIQSWGHELWMNSASDKNCAQVVWSSAVQIRRYCSSHWLAHSLVPSVLGWNAVDTFRCMWRRWHSSFVKCDMNLGSWSLMIFRGMPNHRTKCWRYNAATSCPVIVVLHGMNLATFKHPWSIIVSTALKPLDSGRSVIKSMATIWKGPEWRSIVIGWSGAFWCVVCGLFCWHVAQPRTYSSAKSFISFPW